MDQPLFQIWASVFHVRVRESSLKSVELKLISNSTVVYRSQNARLEPEQSIAVVDATSWNIRSSSILLISSLRRFLAIVHGTSHHLNKDSGRLA